MKMMRAILLMGGTAYSLVNIHLNFLLPSIYTITLHRYGVVGILLAKELMVACVATHECIEQRTLHFFTHTKSIRIARHFHFIVS